MAGYGWVGEPTSIGVYAGTWVPASGSYTPDGAISVGRDADGSEIIAGRAFHGGDMIPAKVIPSRGVAYVPYGGMEHEKFEYEVLTNVEGIAWQPLCNGDIPSRAIIIGKTEQGESLYMGRTYYNGTMTPGKVHCSHKVLYIPFDGKELAFDNYEVLCLI